MELDPKSFFRQMSIPDKLEEKSSRIRSFVERHQSCDTRVVLVSSGGTIVPLESKTVRYIDNFSLGTRGSASAENFLKHGYAVIFLHRARSLEPFSRHFSRYNVLSILEIRNDESGSDQSSVVGQILQSLNSNGVFCSVKKPMLVWKKGLYRVHYMLVSDKYASKVAPILSKYQQVMSSGMLLSVEFTTLTEYLHLLRASSEILRVLKERAMLYLAAAVSDFYIPKDEMGVATSISSKSKMATVTIATFFPQPEHKVQSSNGPLQLSLQLVPKLLAPLVKDWAPEAFVISFKLETDKKLLIRKAQQALEQYRHQIVVANCLDTRKKEVVIITREIHQLIELTEVELSKGTEIEEKLVRELILRHAKFCDKTN